MAPIYDYKGFSSNGKSTKGIIESESIKVARVKLKKQQILITEIQEKHSKKSSFGGSVSVFGRRVSSNDIALLTRQLASLVKANIPLVEALNALVDQTEKEVLKVILSEIREDVNEGSSLAKSLAKHPKVFDVIFINMVEAGESSGTLGLVLLRLADLKEAQMRLRSKIISGMTYPVLMVIIAFFLIVGIFIFVIPKLAEVFESMNKALPLSTQILILISDTFKEYWYVFFAVFISVLWIFKKYIQTKKGRYRWDSFKIKVVIFGPLIRMIAVTRFSRTMSTLLNSGVPIITAMNIARNLVGNVLIEKALDDAKENITEGQSIAQPLKKSGEFPPMVIHMIAIGEKTGELPDMLRNVADTYEEQANAKIEGLSSLVEPLLIVFMGIMVLGIVLAIFVPLLEISNIQ